MEPETRSNTFSSSSSGITITSQLSETTKELNGFVERLAADQSPLPPSGGSGDIIINGNTMGTIGSISGLEDVKFVAVDGSSDDASEGFAALGEGMEIYLEMDDSAMPIVPTGSVIGSPSDAADYDVSSSSTLTSSVSDVLLHEHHGAAYRMMDARRQQMIREVQSTDDRIVALKSKINTM